MQEKQMLDIDNDETDEDEQKENPFSSQNTPEYKAYKLKRNNYCDVSSAFIKQARLTYKRFELLQLESDKLIGLYEDMGFVELKYRDWKRGLYMPTKQEFKIITDFYGIVPSYFETGILPYIKNDSKE